SADLFADGFCHAAVEDNVAGVASEPFFADGGDMDDFGVNMGEIAGGGCENADFVAESDQGVACFADVGGGTFAAAYFHAYITGDVENFHLEFKDRFAFGANKEKVGLW